MFHSSSSSSQSLYILFISLARSLGMTLTIHQIFFSADEFKRVGDRDVFTIWQSAKETIRKIKDVEKESVFWSFQKSSTSTIEVSHSGNMYMDRASTPPNWNSFDWKTVFWLWGSWYRPDSSNRGLVYSFSHDKASTSRRWLVFTPHWSDDYHSNSSRCL